MKILIVSDLWTPFPGGAERFLANIGHELGSRGHKISVLTSYQRATDYQAMIIYRDIGVRERHAEGLKVLDEEIRKAQPDLIIIHHFFAFEFQQEIVKYPLPVVQVLHNGMRIQGVKLAIFNSQYTYDHSNPVPGDMVIHPPAYQEVVSQTHGECIGFVKPLIGKGVEFVYRLAQALPHRQFLILKGEWYTCETIQEYPNVRFMEAVNDIRGFYQQCKLLLMPSLSEDAGTIPQEAAMNGLPCVSSNVMGLLETNRGGIILPPDLEVWKKEIELLFTDAQYYQDVIVREARELLNFKWTEKFDVLSTRLNEIKFVERYRDYNSISREFLKLYPTQQERETFLLNHAIGQILDMGCNDCGLWECYTDRKSVTGVDLSRVAVSAAKQKGFNAYVGRAEYTPFKDKSFDTVAFSELIEHVEDPHALLKEATRLARVQLIGTVPRPTGGWGSWKFDPDHIQFWEREELQKLLGQYGEAQVETLNSDFWSFVVML